MPLTKSNRFRGALVKRTGDQTAANYTTAAAIPFDAEEYDTDGIHDNSANNTRLSVPSGISYVQLSANVQIAAGTATDWALLNLRKTGGGAFAGQPKVFWEVGTAAPILNFTSPVLAVTGGTDYFELMLQVETDTSITVDSDNTWFAMELIG